MGLSIGDSVRSLPTFQRVGALQGARAVASARPAEPLPQPATPGGLAPVDRDEQIRAALREPVGSAPAAAVRALGTNFRAMREQQPSIEERREQVRERFAQAREQIFGPEGEAGVPSAAAVPPADAPTRVDARREGTPELQPLARDEGAPTPARLEIANAAPRDLGQFREVVPTAPQSLATTPTPRVLAQFQPVPAPATEVNLLG